jgi:beta-galactosidase
MKSKLIFASLFLLSVVPGFSKEHLTSQDVDKILPVYAPVPKSIDGVGTSSFSLNGTWQFKEKENGDWKPIRVPGEWSMQGFKVDSAKFATYRRSFSIPSDWEGQRIKIRFDGVFSEYFVFVNGQKAGYHLGGMTPYEIDITQLARPGENTLELNVRSESLADMLGSLTQYAAHQLGGIIRKVTLFAVPEVNITDLRIETKVQPSGADLCLHFAVTNNSAEARQATRASFFVEGLSGQLRCDIPEIEAGETLRRDVSAHFDGVELWSDEHPALYTLSGTLESASGSEHIEKKFGFRQIEVRGNELFVNGKAVKLHGFCRHEMSPTEGRVTTYEQEKKDVELFRAANCNFIRTSHYPPCEEFLDLCDEMGMYVEVEAPICWVGHGANANWVHLNYKDSTYYPYIRQADLETVHFNRNHPSVIFWSMANESYWCETFEKVQEYVELADRTRPHTFHDQAYGGFNNEGSTAPIAIIHYPGPDGYKHVEENRPLQYGEFCHLNVYNRSELETDPGVRCDWGELALYPTWERMYATKGILGGSVWSGIDDVFQMLDGSAVGYGPWGIIDGWRREKPEYWDVKKIYSNIKVLTDSLQPSSSLSLKIENRYTFTNLKEVKAEYRFGNEKGAVYADIPPKAVGTLTIPIKNPSASDKLYISFVDPRGFVADEYMIPVGVQKDEKLDPPPAAKRTRMKQEDDIFIINGKGFRCEVSRSDGRIISLRFNGTETLCGGPSLMVLPLSHGGCLPDLNANTPLLNDVCGGWKASSVTARKDGRNVVVDVAGAYDDFEGSYSMTFNANGTVSVEYQFKALEDINPRQWGMVFDTPRSYDHNFWYHKGLWNLYPENHINRLKGEAPLFYPDDARGRNPRQRPETDWYKDSNSLGCNDFRSVRRNILYAGLKDSEGSSIMAVSDYTQGWRAWTSDDKMHFLVADYVSPGDESFAEGYYHQYRRPIKAGDVIKGKINLQAR